MAASNKAQIIISAKDDTAPAFASAQAGVSKLASAYSALSGIVGAGMVAALASSVRSIIDLGDKMNDLSQRVGVSVQNLATWTLAANQSGTSIEAVANAVQHLAKFMSDNGNALKQAGIDAVDSNGALIQLADLFSAMPNGIQKTALALKLFGRAGVDMIPMLNLGSAGLGEVASKSAEYGRRMELLAPMADEFSDQMAELALQTKETGISIATHMLPGLIGMSKWLNDLAAGGKRAELALEFMSEKSTLFKGLVAWNRLAGRVFALLGVGADDSARLSVGKIGGPSGLDLAGEIALGAKNEKAIEAMSRARILGGGQAADQKRPLGAKQAKDDESVYLASLRRQLSVASGEVSEYGKQLAAISEGPAKEFSQRTKDAALTLAIEIDGLKAATKANEDHARVRAQVARAEDAANKAISDFGFRQDQSIAGIDARRGALGKTPFQIQQSEAAREIQQDYEEAVRAVNAELGKIGDIEGINSKIYALSQARDAAHAATTAALDAEKSKQDALNASWEYGAEISLRKYSEGLQNVAGFTESAMTRAFKGMEDALVSFVATGKLNFRSLADSIIADLIRIEIRKSIMQPLLDVGGLSGIFKSLFGSGVSTGVPKYALGTSYVPSDGLAYLHRGEAVLPAGLSRIGGAITVNIIEDTSRAGQTQRRESGGVNMLDIFVAQVRATIAADISRGSGPVPAALGSTYGLNRAAGAF